MDRLPALALALFVVDLLCTSALVALASERWLAAGFAAVLMTSRYGSRLYRPRVRLSWLDDIPRSLLTLTLATGVCLVAVVLLGSDPSATPGFVRAILAFLIVNELLRLLCLAAGRIARRRFGVGDNVLILGAGVVGLALANTMLERPELGLNPIGFIDSDPRKGDSAVPVLSGTRSQLAEVIEEHRVGTVVVSFALTREAELVDTVITAHQMDCTVFVVPRMYELHHDGADVERLRGYPLVRLNPDPTSRPAWWVKRGLDVILAAVALVILSPVLAIAALAVLVESGRPLLFHQVRVGLDGKPIRIHKIRSLRPATEAEAETRWSIATDQRVGAVGRFLRKTSIDELPQLWNILRGDMSFVGPRPERPGFVEVFSIEHERYWARHRVPAGLTGLAQVNGLRGDTSIADRARFDNYYIANWSLWVDLRIVILTIREVLRGAGG
jgi:exopolysaccharide biosynthesis polyprenyl glycosylphosphotransferase